MTAVTPLARRVLRRVVPAPLHPHGRRIRDRLLEHRLLAKVPPPDGSPAGAGGQAATGLLTAELVRSQWARVEILERMDESVAKALLSRELAAHARHTTKTLPLLEPWPSVPANRLAVYQNRSNQVRMRRALDFLVPGDRILDIGVNYGYLSGVVLRDARPSHYIGIDLADHLLASVRDMAAVNGLADASVHLEVKNIYDLSTEWVAGHAPDIVMLMEVLEHVPDAADALRVLGSAIPERTCVLFSVPLLGRLEACWGHVSLFDADRVREMCQAAGLRVHHVEPLFNTWILVLAAAADDVPERALQVMRREPRPPARPLLRNHDYVPLTLKDAYLEDGASGVRLEEGHPGLRCSVAAPPGSEPTSGVIRLPLATFEAVRFDVDLAQAGPVRELVLEAVTRRGEPWARWRWTVDESRPLPNSRKTYVFRRGQSAGPWRTEDVGEVKGPVDTARLSLAVDAGGTSHIHLLRVAHVPLG